MQIHNAYSLINYAEVCRVTIFFGRKL